MENIEETIKKFQKFTKSEIDSAIKELGNIKTEANRKHLQRLVYVNLVNRFDSFVDSLLLDFALKDSAFKNKVLNETKEEPVFLKNLYEILLSENPQDSVKKKLQGIVSLRFLNQRHSSKLRILLKDCFEFPDSDLDRPRVFVNNGSLFKDVKKQKENKIPDTIIGYSDWLYSRRNSLVHHNKPEIIKGDADIIQKKFKVKLSPNISLKISSIKSASKFYLDLTEEMEKYLSNLDEDI